MQVGLYTRDVRTLLRAQEVLDVGAIDPNDVIIVGIDQALRVDSEDWWRAATRAVHVLGRAAPERLAQVPEVVLAAPVSLNVVCFRFAPAGMSPEAQDTLNKEILLRVQESGVAVVSGSKIADRYVIRVACSNHRTRWEDFEVFVEAAQRIRREVAA